MLMKRNALNRSTLITLLVLLSSGMSSQSLSIIPQPEMITFQEGKYNITEKTGLKFNTADKDLQRIHVYFLIWLLMI